MSGYFVKNPTSTLDYTFDWGFQLFEAGETIASDEGWSVDPDSSGAGGLSVLVTASTPTTTTAHLTGGIAGEAYQVSSAIQTDQGRRIERSQIVRVANV